MAGFSIFTKMVMSQAPLQVTIEAFINEVGKPLRDEEVQTLFAQGLMPMDERFPTNPRYVLRLLQLYTTKIAPVDPSSDLFAEMLFNALHPPPPEPSSDFTCFLSFDDDRINGTVGVRISPFHNDVGLRVWEAGYFLAEYICSNPGILTGHTVMEMGAGCGLTGIVAAAVSKAKSMLLTDYTDPVLSNMRFNVEINKDAYLANSETTIDVDFLDWCQVAEANNESSPLLQRLASIDVILAADVIYDVTVVPQLVTTVRKFMESGPSPKSKVAYFATTYRNEKTFQVFTKELEKASIHSTLIHLSPDYHIFPAFYIASDRDQVKLHKFTIT